MRVSRTVQWFIAASGRKDTGFKRIVDEVAITSSYLSSFSYFLFDYSKEHANTRGLLKKLLRKVDKCQQLFFTKPRKKPTFTSQEGPPEAQ